jgi:uncharacterized membrane protein
MKRAWKIVQDGILILTPFVVLIYAVVYTLKFINKIGKDLLAGFRWADVRGVGLLAVVLLIAAAGLLWQNRSVRHALGVLERKLNRMPMLCTLYRIIKELTRSAVGKKQPFTRVVLVSRPNGERQIGLLTAEDVTAVDLPDTHAAVFLPLGMQVGGHLVLVPKDQLEPVDMTVEAALRFCLTGGVSVRD